MGTFGQNLRFAARQLGRNPGFTFTVIFTLALSIGANTAIFSIVNALMLKSLPYAHPERMSAMAALALLLSAVGIFALVANMVAGRTREIGIRIALGSSIRRAMIQVGGPGVRASAFGLLAGLILCMGALRALRSVLYGVGVYDAPTILAVVLTLLSVTLLATTLPTLRIASIDPAKTLRDE